MRLLLSASRYFRVWAGGTGTGLSSRTAVLHWQSQRHHCGNHDWWLTQTRYIQRSKQSSSRHCCRLLQQVNQNHCYYIYNITVIWLRVHYSSPVMFYFNFNTDTLLEPYLGKMRLHRSQELKEMLPEGVLSRPPIAIRTDFWQPHKNEGKAEIDHILTSVYCPWQSEHTLCLRKKQDTKLLPITSPNVNRFSKFFHW